MVPAQEGEGCGASRNYRLSQPSPFQKPPRSSVRFPGCLFLILRGFLFLFLASPYQNISQGKILEVFSIRNTVLPPQQEILGCSSRLCTPTHSPPAPLQEGQGEPWWATLPSQGDFAHVPELLRSLLSFPLKEEGLTVYLWILRQCVGGGAQERRGPQPTLASGPPLHSFWHLLSSCREGHTSPGVSFSNQAIQKKMNSQSKSSLPQKQRNGL